MKQPGRINRKTRGIVESWLLCHALPKFNTAVNKPWAALLCLKMNMHLPDFSQPLWFALATLIIFAVVIGRYFLIAGLFHGLFYLWFPQRWQSRQVNQSKYKPGQFRREVKWSVITALLFALAGSGLLVLWQKGYTKVYLSIHDYPLWWLPVSLIIAMLLHETYYYWLHRWMHQPKIFRIVHKVHHDSHITSAWTAF